MIILLSYRCLNPPVIYKTWNNSNIGAMAITKETIDAAENEISNDLNICMVIHVDPVKELPKKIGSTIAHFH